MISVLLPSRGRPELLAVSVASLRTTALGQVEFLIRVDDEDPQLARYEQWAHDRAYARLVVGPALGYARLHEYVNQLAAMAQGGFLLLWNDDARMETVGWDRMLTDKIHPDVPAVASLTPLATEGNVFPVVTRAFYETLGHFTLAPHCDSWVERVSLEAGCHHDLSHLIHTTHEHLSMHDDTRAGVLAAVETTSPAFYSDEMKRLRSLDVAKIRHALLDRLAPYGGQAA